MTGMCFSGVGEEGVWQAWLDLGSGHFQHEIWSYPFVRVPPNLVEIQ